MIPIPPTTGPRRQSAYLMARIDTIEDRVTQYAIMSDPNPTSDGFNMTWAMIAEASGADYDTACENLMKHIRRNMPHFVGASRRLLVDALAARG